MPRRRIAKGAARSRAQIAAQQKAAEASARKRRKRGGDEPSARRAVARLDTNAPNNKRDIVALKEATKGGTAKGKVSLAASAKVGRENVINDADRIAYRAAAAESRKLKVTLGDNAPTADKIFSTAKKIAKIRAGDDDVKIADVKKASLSLDPDEKTPDVAKKVPLKDRSIVVPDNGPKPVVSKDRQEFAAKGATVTATQKRAKGMTEKQIQDELAAMMKAHPGGEGLSEGQKLIRSALRTELNKRSKTEAKPGTLLRRDGSPRDPQGTKVGDVIRGNRIAKKSDSSEETVAKSKVESVKRIVGVVHDVGQAPKVEVNNITNGVTITPNEGGPISVAQRRLITARLREAGYRDIAINQNKKPESGAYRSSDRANGKPRGTDTAGPAAPVINTPKKAPRATAAERKAMESRLYEGLDEATIRQAIQNLQDKKYRAEPLDAGEKKRLIGLNAELKKRKSAAGKPDGPNLTDAQYDAMSLDEIRAHYAKYLKTRADVDKLTGRALSLAYDLIDDEDLRRYIFQKVMKR